MWRVLLLILFLAGCASTDMTSQVDRSAPKMYSVAVLAAGVTKAEREIIESTIANEFIGEGVRAYRSLDYLPIRYTLNDVPALWDLGVDSVLVIYGGNKSSNVGAYIPGQTYSNTTGTLYNGGNIATYSGNTYTYSTPGYFLSFPAAGYSAMLLSREKIIWDADALSTGGAAADYEDLAKSMAKKTVKTLIEDGLF